MSEEKETPKPVIMPVTTSISFAGGKYTVQHESGANLRALRYGQPWRDLEGDGLVLAMAQCIEELQNALKEARK